MILANSGSCVSCNGLHDKTQVQAKLQNVHQSTKPAKNLGDHTLHVFDFPTTVHNMTFDIVKFDVFDVKKTFGQTAKIGRAYLPLRELLKKVGNKYDNDGNDNTEPEQSVLSSLFDATAFCKQHDDEFEFDLPLYKHGSYTHIASSIRRQQHSQAKGEKEKEVIVTKGEENKKDVTVVTHPRRPERTDSYAQMDKNGFEVGMITVQATLHFKDQTKNPLFAHLGKGTGRPLNSPADRLERSWSRKSRSNTNQSLDSTISSDSSTLGDSHRQSSSGYFSDNPQVHSPTGHDQVGGPLTKALSAPIIIPHGNSNSPSSPEQPHRIMKTPSSPPNVSVNYSSPTVGSQPISPPLSPTLLQSPGSPNSPSGTPLDWLSDGAIPQGVVTSWEDHDLHYGEGFVDAEDVEFGEDILNVLKSNQVKGEHLSEEDRRREEELMADIMANGDQSKKDRYLNRPPNNKKGQDQRDKSNKKPKFNLFSEKTRSAFKDIQLMYSSFFGHGWNLTRSEFWRGFHIVEKYYERHPTPTTNKAFDNIEVLEKARHFIRLAIASYGSLPWVYFGYSFKVAPLNFIRFNSDRKNVQDYFKLKKEDMIVWHFDKRTALVPSYYIVRDPKFNALCVIIRGTFSITDAMTDLVCEYYPYKGGLVHKGIMDNARFVLERSIKDIEAALEKFNLKTIYCIGHSLGAGSASLLCSLLQDHFAQYIIPSTLNTTRESLEIMAYLFAPPPICTPNLAAEWERTQIAFINENDIVCRLSYGNALDLKELIKIGALESLDPRYDGLSSKEKLDRILNVLEKAQESLREVDDIPRLVTGGTVTYLHKVYEDTPVVQNEGRSQGSKFGQPETTSSSQTSPESLRDSSIHTVGIPNANNALSRSLTAITAALSLKNHSVAHRSLEDSAMEDKRNTVPRVPKVTPYQPDQPPVRLESTISLVLSDSSSSHKSVAQAVESTVAGTTQTAAGKEPTLASTDEGLAATKNLGEPIKFDGTSKARTLAMQHVLDKNHQAKAEATPVQPTPSKEKTTESDKQDTLSAQGSEEANEEEYDSESGNEEDDEEEKKVYTTKKPRKNGSKKKEIRIEFSDKEHFMAIPLRSNWLWHHFPQQYDSRIERALAWAKENKEKQDQRQAARETRREQRKQMRR
ncbi:hypothetical protein BGW38_010692 [Lunasporangiospora selenospora]|uniref:sn-1-specific diacylglycerol lipase n=1 Tax=Lunasporangiospora selenospora TaxID=979761 RepID=A0A9P6FWP9_9FUNG|nr:hypothetical protein BGW38_010692 [Lunasporangiospora selenospora]